MGKHLKRVLFISLSVIIVFSTQSLIPSWPIEEAQAREVSHGVYEDFDDGQANGFSNTTDYSVNNGIYKVSVTASEANNKISTYQTTTFTDVFIKTKIRMEKTSGSGTTPAVQPGVVFRYQNSTSHYGVMLDGSNSKLKFYKDDTADMVEETAYTFQYDTDYVLKVTLTGTTLNAYLYNADETSLLASLTKETSTYSSAGNVGVRTIAPATNADSVDVKYDDFIVNARGINEDFGDGTANNFTDSSSVYTVLNGEYKTQVSKTQQQINQLNRAYYNTGDSNSKSKNINISAKIRFDAGSEDGRVWSDAGVYFRYVDDNTVYGGVVLDGANQVLKFFKRTGAIEVNLETIPMKVESNVNYVLKLTMIDGDVSVKVYNAADMIKPMVTMKGSTADSTLVAQSGNVGVWARIADTNAPNVTDTVYFDEFQYNYIPAVKADVSAGQVANNRVNLYSAEGADIYYTTDGSTPKIGSSYLYAEPILIDGTPGTTITVKAIASWREYTDPEDVATFTYTIAEIDEDFNDGTADNFEFTNTSCNSVASGVFNCIAKYNTKIWARNTQFTNIVDAEISTDVTFRSSQMASNFDVVFRYVNDTNYYCVRLDVALGYFYILKNGLTILDSKITTYSKDEKYTIKISAKGNLIEANLFNSSGENYRSLIGADTGTVSGGKTGIMTNGRGQNDETIEVDNFKVNAFDARGIVDVGTYQTPGGLFFNPLRVALFTERYGSNIRYTTDGSEPTASSALYSDAIALSTGTDVTIKARAEKGGTLQGSAVTFKYDIMSEANFPSKMVAGSHLPGFTLNKDNENLFQDYHIMPVSTDSIDNLETQMNNAYTSGNDAFVTDFIYAAQAAQFDEFEDEITACARLRNNGKTFYLIPEMDVLVERHNNTTTQIKTLMEDFLKEFGTNDCVLKVNNRVIFYTFAGDAFTPSQWKEVIDGIYNDFENDSNLSAEIKALKKVYVIVDMTRTRKIGYSDPVYQRYMDVVNGAFMFTDVSTDLKLEHDDQMVDGAKARYDKKVVVSSVQKTYWRPEFGVIVPAEGSGKFREEWEYFMKRKPEFVHVTTLDDYTENAVIEPTRKNAYVMAKLNKYYSDWLKNGAEQTSSNEDIFVTVPEEAFIGETYTVELVGLKRSTAGKYVRVHIEDSDGNIVHQSNTTYMTNANLNEFNVDVPTKTLYNKLWLRPRIYVSSSTFDASSLPSTYKLGDFTRINRVSKSNYNYVRRELNNLLDSSQTLTITPKKQGNTASPIASGWGTYLKSDVESFDVNVDGISNVKEVKLYRGSANQGETDVALRDYRVFTYGDTQSIPSGKERLTLSITWQGNVNTSDNWNGYLTFSENPTIVNYKYDSFDGGTESLVKSTNSSTGYDQLRWISSTPFTNTPYANFGYDGILVDLIYDPTKDITLDFDDTSLDDKTFTLNQLKSGAIEMGQMSSKNGFASIRLVDKSIKPNNGSTISLPLSFNHAIEYYDSVPLSYYYAEIQTTDDKIIRSKPIFIQSTNDVSTVSSKVYVDSEAASYSISILNIEKTVAEFNFDESGTNAGPRYFDATGNNQYAIGGGSVLHTFLYGADTRSASRVTGYSGNGLSFDGIDDYAILSSSMVPIGSSTVQMKIKLTQLKEHRIFWMINGAYSISVFPSGKINVERKIGNVTPVTYTILTDDSHKLSANTWYDIAVTSDTETMKLYVNGSLWGQTNVSGKARNGFPYVGYWASPIGMTSWTSQDTRMFDGILDDLKITAVPYTP